MSNFLSTFKGKVIVLSILFIIILSGVIYYFMYGSSEAKYTRNIKSIISHINNSNNHLTSTYNYLDSGKSSFDKIKSSLDKSKKEINTALSEAKNTAPLDNFKKDHSNLINGITSNKLLIEQSITILENYSSDTVNASINSLYEYLSNTVGYYEKFSYKNSKINISNDFLNFPDKLSYYIDILVKEEVGSTSKNSEALDFINDLKLNLDEINSINTSFEENINSVKNGKTSINQFKIFISSNINKVSSIIDKVNNLSTPLELKELQTQFISIGVLYEDYLKSFKSSLESSEEKNNNSILNTSINMNKDILENFELKRSSLLSSIKEKEDSLR